MLPSSPRLVAFLLAPLLLAAAPDDGKPKGGDAAGRSIDERHADALKAAAAEGWADAPVVERTVTTKHDVTAAGRKWDYLATAGTLTLRDQEGKPTASMFYTAYTLDGTKPGTKRPITFFYNGGPGSPSFWLHMGSFAPMRIRTGNPDYIRPAPYDFGPNPDTLLPKTDMVFLDAIGSGWSRPLGDAKPSDFYGVDQDADAFAKAILRYVDKFGRWSSPKVIFGESYGTTRSGALAWQLQNRGLALNGVVLLSSIMNYGSRQPGLDQIYLNYLPSYAATAWYHDRVPDRPADVASFVAEARAFAVGSYAAALAKGQSITPEERERVAQQLSRFTGLSPQYLIAANLRVDLSRFRKELLRQQRLTVGRFDSRYTGVDPDAAGEGPDFDASDEAISGAFIASFHDYVGHVLHYDTDMPYRLSARDAAGWKWDWQHKAPGSDWPQNNPDTAIDLAAAMRTNPYLKVLSMNGWYDMATPFGGTEYDLGHMMLEPAQAANLSFTYYPAGHMTYLNPDALHAMRRDLDRWYDTATGVGGQPLTRAPVSAAGPSPRGGTGPSR